MGGSVSGKEAPLSALRAMLVVISLIGTFGTAAELLLIEHTEGWRQWIPLALQGFAIVVWLWHLADRGPKSTRAIQIIMIAFIASGVAGMYYHLLGSVEFKLESNPALSGWTLIWEAARSKNPPSLAPGVMIQLGLLGLVYTYRNPNLVKY